MPLFWLRISVLFYALGLLYALSVVSRPCSWLARYIPQIMGFGMVFHFVSLAETAMLSGQLSLAAMSVYDSESMLFELLLYHGVLTVGWTFATAVSRAREALSDLGLKGTRGKGQCFVRVF